MSLLPYFFNYDLPNWPHRLFDQNFGLALTPQDLTSSAPILPFQFPKDIESTIKVDKDKWQINVDVQHFSPEEITVKTTDNFVVIEGKHEEKEDEHGFIARQFIRRFQLPEDSNPDAVESRLSSDGVLTVVAPRKAAAEKDGRSVPITQTGPVRKVADGTNDVK